MDFSAPEIPSVVIENPAFFRSLLLDSADRKKLPPTSDELPLTMTSASFRMNMEIARNPRFRKLVTSFAAF